MQNVIIFFSQKSGEMNQVNLYQLGILKVLFLVYILKMLTCQIEGKQVE